MAAMPQSYIERILKARVYDIAAESPLTLAKGLSRRLGNQVFLKREDLQPVFSFKLRGATTSFGTWIRRRASAASSPHRPATTPKACPWARAGSASRRSS
jgi:threonine dehydratase